MSSIPDLTPPGPRVSGIDKLFHVGEYALLGVLWGRALRLRRHGFWFGAILGLVVGILDELYQGRVPGREMDAVDALADTLGAGLGSQVWVWGSRRLQARNRRPTRVMPNERL
jgi:VanZ family protein